MSQHMASYNIRIITHSILLICNKILEKNNWNIPKTLKIYYCSHRMTHMLPNKNPEYKDSIYRITPINGHLDN